MDRIRGFIFLTLLMLRHANFVSAQENIVFSHQQSQSAFPISLIDSLIIPRVNEFALYSEGNITPKVVAAEAALFHTTLPDTLILNFQDEWVGISNPHLEYIDVSTREATVYVTSRGKQPLVCMATGFSKDGRIIIDADTTSTLILSSLQLSSKIGSTIYFKQKHKAEIVLADGTKNTLNDAKKYTTSDTTDTSNACLYAKGSLTFSGTGSLDVNGSYRHAIASSRNITIFNGHVNIPNTKKDGIHCDKYKQTGGTVRLNLTQTATKGIKTKEEFELKGGRIEGEATGDLKIEDGETSYCTFIKSDSLFTMSGGDIQLKHTGKGGRCISVDRNFNMRGGTMSLECHGDGGSYLTVANDSDYYTPKCVTANGNMIIERGKINCIATGNGGKGIDCSDMLFIGRQGDPYVSEDSMLINVQTHGWCLEDNVNEDFRRGCPKAIKCDNDIYLYSGNLRLNTHGQGGEGIEAKGSLRAYNATIIADCYDDGINTGQRCYIDGAHIFCRSINNDGIDSNGKMTVMDGIVAAISEHYENESFDTEGSSLNLYGGHIIGIGNDEVNVSQQSTLPYYSTPSWRLRFGFQCGDSIAIQSNCYLTISKGNETIVSLRHEYGSPDAFITVASADMQKGTTYQISDGEQPLNPSATWLDDRVIIGGILSKEQIPLFNFQIF